MANNLTSNSSSTPSSSMLTSFKPVTHCIFDMDGLLLDTEPLYEVAINNLTMKYGKPYTFEIKLKVMGTPARDGARIVIDCCNLPLTVDEYLDQMAAEYVSVFTKPVPMLPGVARLITHLHAHGIPMAIATSSKKSNYELKSKHYKEIFDKFHHVLIASDDPEITRGKPDPQSYLVCAGRFDAPKPPMDKCLVFEDSPAGVQAGMSAGMQVVWVPDVRLDRNIAKPTVTLNSLEEFKPEWFGLPPFKE